MCGRFTQTSPLADYQERFGFGPEVLEYAPRYNLAPSQDALVVLSGGQGRRAALLRWGLVPRWAKDPAMGARLINARAESLGQKPAFRGPLAGRRCLVPANGFYEWKQGPSSRRPYLFRLAGVRPFALAGLWDAWQDSAGRTLRSFTIITTEANEVVARAHPRMPVILRPEHEAAWLDAGGTDMRQLQRLLAPHPAEVMEAVAVSTMVNTPDNEGPGLIEPVADQLGLFGD